MLTEGPGPPSEAHRLTVWRWRYVAVDKTLFTDGPLKKPTAAKQCSGWAVWDVGAIMGFNCLPRGRYSDSETCGQINQIICIIFYAYLFLFLLSAHCFPKNKKMYFQGPIWHYSFLLSCGGHYMTFISNVNNCNNCSSNSYSSKHRDETGSEAHTGCHSSLCIFIVQLPPAFQLVNIMWHFYEDNRKEVKLLQRSTAEISTQKNNLQPSENHVRKWNKPAVHLRWYSTEGQINLDE